MLNLPTTTSTTPWLGTVSAKAAVHIRLLLRVQLLDSILLLAPRKQPMRRYLLYKMLETDD
eukprot:COSAG06_NODE_5961_length_3182_cov_85.789491_6_plen_61_part_00